jgi:ferric-dicitrate binding protein FerR (iron transport regulator)
MNEQTGGSETRESRSLDEPLMAFDLAAELATLRAEPAYRDNGRTSKTLARSGPLRLVLTAVRAGTEMGAERPDGPVAVEVLEGRVAADAGTDGAGDGRQLGPGSVAWFAGERAWHLHMDDDAALLLSVVGDDDGLGRPAR